MQRARSRWRREDGAVAVEAALVLPLLCVLVFGMIEFAFALRDYGSVSSMSRTGARMASTAADDGPATTCAGTNGVVTTCAANTVPAAAQLAADAIQRSGAIADPTSINYILVYKANDSGLPGTATTMPATDCGGAASCVKFTWVPAQSAFRYSSGTWNSTTISACFPGNTTNPLDRVGVYVNTTHRMITGLFGSTLSIKDRTVMDFEPLPTTSCNGTGPTSGGHL
jgi:Flp pilus assembly protein TadG